MSALRSWWIRLSSLWGKEGKDRELAAELESHLQMHIEDNVRVGMTPEAARRDALLRLGGLDQTKEKVRERRGLPLLESLLQDVRFGLRMLRKNPGFTTVVVLTLALGIGANTAMFSIIDAVLLRPLPFRNPDRLVQLWTTQRSPGNYPVSVLDYLDWRSQSSILSEMTIYNAGHVYNLSGQGEPSLARAINVESNFFSVLGVEPKYGRAFAEGEDRAGSNHVVILSYAYWQRQFGGSASLLGQSIQLSNEPYTVVGIMPPGYDFPTPVFPVTDIWVPLEMSAAARGPRSEYDFLAIGRLKSGTSWKSAQAELTGIADRLERQYPQTNEKVGILVVPLKEQITHYARLALLTLSAVVGVVLLIACMNISSLMLARAWKRQREAALRAALGATRSRLMRQLITESVLLSCFGGAMGLVLAVIVLRFFSSVEAIPIPRISSSQLFDSGSLPAVNLIRINVTVLLFAIVLSIAAAIICGLVPALQISSFHLNEYLKAGAKALARPFGPRNLQTALIVGELALSLMLLVATGLLLRSLVNMRKSQIGIEARNIVTMSLFLPDAKYPDANARRQFVDRLIDGIGRAPGVTQVALASRLPLVGISGSYVYPDDATSPDVKGVLLDTDWISPDYFGVFRIPLVEGRTFAADEVRRAELASEAIGAVIRQNPSGFAIPVNLSSVAVISARAAQVLWPNQDPLGKTFKWGGPTGQPLRVVGVAGDVKARGIREPATPEIYVPISIIFPLHDIGFSIAVKTGLPPEQALGGIRAQIAAIDNSLPISQVRTMSEVISGTMQDMNIQASIFSAFAGLALLLVNLGIYAVTAYLVTQRTAELGVRMALGAKPADIFRLILGNGARLAVLGLAMGVLASFTATRVISNLLFGVGRNDLGTYVVVAVSLAATVLLACYFPARRAAKIDPMVALRYE